MPNLISLLLATALVSLQWTTEANAQFRKRDLDNDIQANVVPTPRRRMKSNYVKISQAPPKSVRHVAGALLELECDAGGNPAPSVHWLKNGSPIGDYEGETNEILIPHPSSRAHLISKLVLTAASDGDVYTCVATAGLNQKTASTTVFVVQNEDSEELLALQGPVAMSKPIITTSYEFILQNMGTSVVLPCRVQSFTKPQVYWTDNNDHLIYGDSRKQILPSGDLYINGLNFDLDMGGFTCTAVNMYGKTSTTTFLYPLKVKD